MGGPITVVTSGANINTTNPNEIIMNSSDPFTKLDTTNIASFQTINLLFNHEPPEPTLINPYTNTLVYQFPHNYSYTPRSWMMWQNPAPSYPALPGVGGSAYTYNAFGDDTSCQNIIGGATSIGLFSSVAYNDPSFGLIQYATVSFFVSMLDTKYVYIYLQKRMNLATSGGTEVPMFVEGQTANIRVYIFTEPLLTSNF